MLQLSVDKACMHPHMAASEMLAAVSRMPGMAGQDVDTGGVYTQRDIKGDKLWVEWPQHQWPKDWHGKHKRHACRLIKALQGQPKPGFYWEPDCREALLECDVRPVVVAGERRYTH